MRRKILHLLPFIIAGIAISLVIVVEIDAFFWRTYRTNLFSDFMYILFKRSTPIYFNNWMLYTMIAAVMSIVFALQKTYTWRKALIAIIVNVVPCYMIFAYAVTNM